MKKLFLKSLTLIMMLMLSVSTWGATQYCETPSGHLGDANFGDRNACVKLTIVQSSEAGFVDVTLAMNRDLSATSKIDYVYVLYKGLPYTAGTDDNGDALDELTAHVNVGGAASGNLMIQYSNPNWGGRWQIELADVDFTATCTAGPVAPVASTWEACDVNIAKDAPVFISARWGGDKAKAVDDVVNGDNIQLQVTGAQPTEWLVIDLGANFDIAKFSLSTTGDRKDKKFAICTAPAQASAPVFADGTDALSGVWKEEYVFDDEYANTGLTTLTYTVDWKNVRYIKYQATERNHSDLYGTSICEFRVKCAATKNVTGITLDQTTASVPANKTLTLTATVAPADAANKNIIWTSSDETIATVVDGVVTPQAVGGPVTITARTEDGNFTATCAVTVTTALPTEPTAAPEAPTYAADKVRALYSATYSTDCNHGAWGGSQSFTKEAYGIKIVLNPGNGYVGLVDFPARDCSTMEKFHADVWVEDNARMRFVPITGQAEQGVFKDLVGGQWNSIEIALNEGDWAQTTDWSNVFQLKIDNAPGLTFWINNVYFYTTQDEDVTKPVMTSASLESASYLSAIINVAATDDRGVTKYIVKNGDAEVGKFVPADGKITVIGLTDGTAYTLSIYAQDAAENVSDNKVDVELTTLALPDAPAAPDVAAKDYRAVYAPSLTNMLAHDFTLANWGSAAGTKVADKGYIFYHTTNNATVVWGENNAGGNAIVAADAYKGDKGGLDASAMEYMHVDIWADKAGCNSLVLVVNDHNVGPAQTLNAGWNSLDIALSNFNPLDPNNNYLLDNVAWIKFIGLNNTNDVAITNVYFWISTSTTKTVAATKNIAEAGTAVVKQNGVEVTEAENGSEVTFHAEANDGYLFLGWYAGAELKSTDADYVVTVDGNTTLQARFRALNNIYCHTELTNGGDKTIYLTMKRTAENQYQVIIDSEEEMAGFSNAYIGGINGGSQIKLNEPGPKAENVVLSDNKHRLTVNVTSTTPIRWNSPIYINMPGEFTFNQPVNPWNQTIEYDVTCAPVAVESVTLNQTEATVDVDGTITLTASASPIYADNQNVVWTSSNETVATVANGVVTGHVEGNATITATIDGKTATCAITVALDPTVPHVAAPAVDATGKEIRAIYTDDVELAITNAEFGLNVYGNAPYKKMAIGGNNFLLYTATEDKQVISWGSGNGAANALLGKEGVTNPDNAGDKGLYAADMKYLHIDIWSSAAATNFQIQNDNNIICMVDLNGSGWQSFDIDMTGKENNLKNISIMKFANTPRNTKVALDNLYFWKLEDVHATGVSLNKTETSIVEGAQETLVATIAPANATLTACTWESNNTAVATVADGVVTAVAPGEATITVTTVDGGFTASCVVTVTADPYASDWVELENGANRIQYLAIHYSGSNIYTLTIEGLSANVTGMGGAYWNVNGVGARIDAGKEQISAAAIRMQVESTSAPQMYTPFYVMMPGEVNFGQFTINWLDKEAPATPATGVELNEESYEMIVGEDYTLLANVLPALATNKTVTWSSNKESVATVADGVVTAIAPGEATITATTEDGEFTANCVITVVASLTSTTTNGEGSDAGVSIKYFITRNADRTLTYIAYVQSEKAVNAQVNVHGDANYSQMTKQSDGSYSFTTTEKFTDGTIVGGFFWMPYDGGVGGIDYTYTVGSGSTAPLAQLDETVDEISALNALDGETVDLVVNRTISGNGLWNTLCLPFSMTAAQIEATFGVGTQILTLADAYMKSAEDLYVAYNTVTAIEAGHPYLIKTTDAIPALFFEGITVDADAETTAAVGGLVQMIGTFCKTTIPAGPDYLYLSASDGYLYNYGAELAIKAFRCYYQLIGEAGTQVRAGGRVRARVVMGEQVATSLDNTSVEQAPRKLLINGELFILSAGHMYNAEGQLVK